jgi:hypothetical protein
MNDYRITVYLSRDFARTCRLRTAADFKQALADESYASGYVLIAKADTPTAAAEVAFAVTNSYPDELHCPARYRDDVVLYRAAGYRSLSVGDLVAVRPLRGEGEQVRSIPLTELELGRYWLGCGPLGWVALELEPRP